MFERLANKPYNIFRFLETFRFQEAESNEYPFSMVLATAVWINSRNFLTLYHGILTIIASMKCYSLSSKSRIPRLSNMFPI